MKFREMVTRSLIYSACALGIGQSAIAERPILTSDDKSIAAFLDGPGCAETVKTIFRAKSTDAFASGNLTAGRLMNNITALVSKSCAQVSLVRTTGIVDDHKVYSGVADAETGWEIVEYGVRNSGGFIAGGAQTGDTPELPEYLSSASFLAFREVVGIADEAPFLCAEYEDVSSTCSLVTSLSDVSADGATMITKQLIDDDGAIGTVTLAGVASDGLWCGNPQEAVVTANGGKLVEGSKSQVAMEEMLLERVQDAGEKVCVGYAQDSKGLSTTQFNVDGFQLFTAVPLKPMTSMPSLRRD